MAQSDQIELQHVQRLIEAAQRKGEGRLRLPELLRFLDSPRGPILDPATCLSARRLEDGWGKTKQGAAPRVVEAMRVDAQGRPVLVTVLDGVYTVLSDNRSWRLMEFDPGEPNPKVRILGFRDGLPVTEIRKLNQSPRIWVGENGMAYPWVTGAAQSESLPTGEIVEMVKGEDHLIVFFEGKSFYTCGLHSSINACRMFVASQGDEVGVFIIRTISEWKYDFDWIVFSRLRGTVIRSHRGSVSGENWSKTHAIQMHDGCIRVIDTKGKSHVRKESDLSTSSIYHLGYNAEVFPREYAILPNERPAFIARVEGGERWLWRDPLNFLRAEPSFDCVSELMDGQRYYAAHGRFIYLMQIP